jgi:tetratricopeptide (TPR) repeat protein/predicted Ser/Thr protein kinase
MDSTEPATHSSVPARFGMRERAMLSRLSERLLGASEEVTVAGYQVLEEIGSGGMGTVFLAHDETLDRRVALKLLRPRASQDPSAVVEQLRAEAKALARVNHPNVVTVYEVGECGEEVYLAMEYVEGPDLRGWAESRVLEGMPSTTDDALSVLEAAARGLAAAHEAGLMHLDFKPSNVLVGNDGRVRVADFGLARLMPTVDETLEDDASDDGPRRVCGTLRYMSPEQQRADPIDARTDQFAFCCSAWEVLFGEHPWDGFPDGSTPALSRRAPLGLEALLRRGLSPDPDDRFPSMNALLQRWPSFRRQRRRRMAWASLGVVATVGFAAGTLSDAASRCSVDADAARELWTPARRDALETALMARAPAFVQERSGALLSKIDGHADAWAVATAEVCEREDDAQPDAAACLRESLTQLSALTTVLTERPADSWPRVLDELEALPAPGLCSDATFLEQGALTFASRVDPASDAEPWDTLNVARLHREGGHLDDATATMATLDSPQRRSPKFESAVVYERARLAMALEHTDVAVPLLIDAYAHAARVGDGERAVKAAGWLAFRLAESGDSAGAERWIRASEKATEGLFSPRLEAFRQKVVGDVAVGLERWDEARQAYERAVELGGAFPQRRSTRFSLLRALAEVQFASGRREEAFALIEEARQLLDEGGLPRTERSWLAYTQFGFALEQDHFDEAERLAALSLSEARRTLPAEHPQIARALTALAALDSLRGEPSAGLERFAEADAIYAKRRDRESALERAYTLSRWASSLALLGREEEALEKVQSVVDVRERFLVARSRDIAIAYAELAYVEAALGKNELAVAHYRDALAGLRRFADRGLDIAQLLGNLGATYLELDDYARAQVVLEEQVEQLEALQGPDSLELAQPLHNLGLIAIHEERHDDAMRAFERSLSLLDTSSPMRAFPLSGLAKAMLGAGRPADALARAEDALAAAPTEAFSVRGDAHAAAAEALRAQGKRSAAKEHAHAALQSYADAGPGAAAMAEDFERRWTPH